MKIALTQSAGRLEGLEQALLAQGFEVIRAPLIQTEVLTSARTRALAQSLLACPWLLFTSPTAATAWQALGLPFKQSSIGVVGQKTARAVQAFGGNVKLLAEPQTALGLADVFLQHPEAAAPVGLPRSDRALPTLENELEKNGFTTRPAVIYKTTARNWQGYEADVVLLSSPSAVEALPPKLAKSAKLIALGPSTGATIKDYGWSFVQAKSPDISSIIDAIVALQNLRKGSIYDLEQTQTRA
jgi:uroporphyrinogen-III synthase